MLEFLNCKVEQLDSVDSTNNRLKELAEAGAPEGTAVVAREQTAGRGTGDRTFFSPAGEGLYLSVLLRPRVAAEELLTLTGWVAAAVREAIEKACGAPCQIKWLNDIYLNGKKLCGILAELSPTLDWVVVGIGVNLTQTAHTFREQGLEEIATSLELEGCSVTAEELTRSLLEELEEMYRAFPRNKAEYLCRYRAHCMTVGRQVEYHENGALYRGNACGVDDTFALVVEGPKGRKAVRSGRVTEGKEASV
jgi:BirA family biotin operon repressor/biotin-[acetyl-CoA-carboxylase] ligase